MSSTENSTTNKQEQSGPVLMTIGLGALLLALGFVAGLALGALA